MSGVVARAIELAAECSNFRQIRAKLKEKASRPFRSTFKAAVVRKGAESATNGEC